MSTRLTFQWGVSWSVSHLHLTRIVQKAHTENAAHLLKNPLCMCACVWMQQLNHACQNFPWVKVTLCVQHQRQEGEEPLAQRLWYCWAVRHTGCCCLIWHQRCLEHWLSSLSALPVENFEGWQAFLISIDNLWKMAIWYWDRLGNSYFESLQV